MKRTLPLLIILIISTLFVLLRQGSHQATENLFPKDQLIVFSQTGCPHCESALQFIETTIRPRYPNLGIQILNIAQRDNREKLWQAVRAYQLDPNRVGTPLILFNNRYLMGWDQTTKEKLLILIQQVQAKKS